MTAADLHRAPRLTGTRFTLTGDAPGYPARLRSLNAPPEQLNGIGDPRCLAVPGIALAGTRTPSAYGRHVAGHVAAIAADLRVPLITGAAAGIDEVGARAALAAGGRVVLVVATGPDALPDDRHRSLARDVLAGGGAVVSEYPFDAGTHNGPGNYVSRLLARNRIIVGLGAVLVPASGRLPSGTANAAWTALAAGRPLVVAAPPANADAEDTQLPRAFATPSVPEPGVLRRAGCPAALAGTLQSAPALHHAVAGDPDQLRAALSVLVWATPDRSEEPSRTG